MRKSRKLLGIVSFILLRLVFVESDAFANQLTTWDAQLIEDEIIEKSKICIEPFIEPIGVPVDNEGHFTLPARDCFKVCVN